MKPDKNFRMKKSVKRAILLTKTQDKEKISAFKAGMIQAQLHEEAADRQKFKRTSEVD